MLGRADHEHLELATSLGRVLLTDDEKDFAPLHWQWLAQGRVHAGLIVVSQAMPLGEQIRRVTLIADLMRESESLLGQIMYLSDWGVDAEGEGRGMQTADRRRSVGTI